MKLLQLKQRLLEKNKHLPEHLQYTSCIRSDYKEKLNDYDVRAKMNDKKEKSSSTNYVTKNIDPTTYHKSLDIQGLLNAGSTEENLSQEPMETNETINKLDQIKIIGITGSKGKSTTAFLVHTYLELLGYKSMLYSSIKIESPAGYICSNDACEVPLYNENTLIGLIEEAQVYEPDFIVLEVNESAIEKGLIEGIPFSIRALTNIYSDNNNVQYVKEEYVRLKKSFFENIPTEEESICILGLTGDQSREDFNQLMRVNSKPKVTFGSKYICEKRNADYSNLDCLLFGMESSLQGLNLKVRVKETVFDFKTNMIFQHNALNVVCAISILEALKLFNQERFNQCIQHIVVPGREEVISVNDRTIVIGLSLVPALENFKSYKQNTNQINKIKVLTSSIGTGYAGWNITFSSERFLSLRSNVRRYAMNYAKKYADYVYLTSNDNAAEDPLAIATQMQGYLGNEVPSQIIVDREEAIRKIIMDSEPHDLIYISGRGNRRIFCYSATKAKLFKDTEVVLKVLKELGWK